MIINNTTITEQLNMINMLSKKKKKKAKYRRKYTIVQHVKGKKEENSCGGNLMSKNLLL